MSILGLSFGSYLMTCVWLSIVIGMIGYSLERLVGTRLYRVAYDICHRNPMPVSETRGLLYGQSTNRKISVITVLSIVQSLYMVWSQHVNPAAEIVAAFVEVPAFLVGFALMGFVHPYILRRSTYFDTMDKFGDSVGHMSAGDVKQRLWGYGGSLVERAYALRSRLMPSPKRETSKPVVEAQAEPKVVPLEEAKEDPQDVINRYTRRQ